MNPLPLTLALLPLAVPFQEGAAAGIQADEWPALHLPFSSVEDGALPIETKVLSVLRDGSVCAGGQILLEPDATDPDEALRPLAAWLEATAGAMRRAPVPGGPGETGEIGEAPDEPLLLRVDARAPFEHVQRLMQAAGSARVMIWRLELAVTTDRELAGKDAREPGRALHAHLPTHDAALEQRPTVEVQLRLPEDAAGPGPRALRYEVGGRRLADLAELTRWLAEAGRGESVPLLLLDPEPGVTQGEVVTLMSTAREQGFRELSFTLAPPRRR